MALTSGCTILFFLIAANFEASVLGFTLADVKHAELDTTERLTERSLKSGADPEVNMNFCQIANYHGYKCEEYLHKIETKDGFLLTLHRINGRLSEKRPMARRPVFVQHGLLADSSSWILNLNNESLPFILSDAGFDVWLGNSRGNTYSKMHKTLKPDQEEFWSWSWPEMAEFDLPASLDFVAQSTGHNKMHYIGHSQGTLTAFAHLSQTPNSKISHLLALAPIFKMKHAEGPLKYLAPFSNQIGFIAKLLGVKDFLPSQGLTKWLAEIVCKNNVGDVLCSDVLFMLCGLDRQQMNMTRLPVYVAHTPAGTSVRDMVHFAQMIRTGNCSKFDFGAKQNMVHYKQPYPPTYDISTVKTPVSLFYGDNDILADSTDVQFLVRNIKTLKDNVSIPKWEHLDFIWAKDMKSVLADRLIKIIKSDHVKV